MPFFKVVEVFDIHVKKSDKSEVIDFEVNNLTFLQFNSMLTAR